jgi:hypothetical protein
MFYHEITRKTEKSGVNIIISIIFAFTLTHSFYENIAEYKITLRHIIHAGCHGFFIMFRSIRTSGKADLLPSGFLAVIGKCYGTGGTVLGSIHLC